MKADTDTEGPELFRPVKNAVKDDSNLRFEKKTLSVVILTAATMAVEIIFGLKTKSMALFADGIHMGSHVLAIGLNWMAYFLVRKLNNASGFNGNLQKILPLSGYSSGILLFIFSILIFAGAVTRLISPEVIDFRQALMIAGIGLMVNIVSALLLSHDKSETDFNIRAAYLHVLADAITSIAAITGLFAVMLFRISSIDSVVAILGSVVIASWSVNLVRQSGKVLLDMK
jgi:cobalt-zinc-cadmium efflux system protein